MVGVNFKSSGGSGPASKVVFPPLPKGGGSIELELFRVLQGDHGFSQDVLKGAKVDADGKLVTLPLDNLTTFAKNQLDQEGTMGVPHGEHEGLKQALAIAKQAMAHAKHDLEDARTRVFEAEDALADFEAKKAWGEAKMPASPAEEANPCLWIINGEKHDIHHLETGQLASLWEGLTGSHPPMQHREKIRHLLAYLGQGNAELYLPTVSSYWSKFSWWAKQVVGQVDPPLDFSEQFLVEHPKLVREFAVWWTENGGKDPSLPVMFSINGQEIQVNNFTAAQLKWYWDCASGVDSQVYELPAIRKLMLLLGQERFDKEIPMLASKWAAFLSWAEKVHGQVLGNTCINATALAHQPWMIGEFFSCMTAKETAK